MQGIDYARNLNTVDHIQLLRTMNNLFRGVGRLSNVVMDRASGSFVTTTSGQRLLDFTSGIGVTNTGHCHPKVVSAAKEQCDKLIHGQVNLGYHGPMLELTEELMRPGVMPHNQLDRVFYATTGYVIATV